MRLDHLLSKEIKVGVVVYYLVIKVTKKRSEVTVKRTGGTPGGDALRGHTRTHPEHDG